MEKNKQTAPLLSIYFKKVDQSNNKFHPKHNVFSKLLQTTCMPPYEYYKPISLLCTQR